MCNLNLLLNEVEGIENMLKHLVKKVTQEQQPLREEVIAVDMGASSYKVKTKDERFTFVNAIRKEPNYISNSKSIDIDGISYSIGVGATSKKINKIDKDFKQMILYSICRAFEGSRNLKVTLGLMLPLNQMEISAKEFKDQIENKRFKANFKGEEYSILINSVAVGIEGYSSFFTLDEETALSNVCLCNFGNSTLDYFYFVDGELVEKNVENMGSKQYLQRLNQVLTSNKEGFANIDELDQNLRMDAVFKCKNAVRECNLTYLNEIVENVNAFYNIKNFHMVWCGGATINLKNEIKTLCNENVCKSCRVLNREEAIFSDVEGLFIQLMEIEDEN